MLLQILISFFSQVKITKISLPSGGGRRAKMYPLQNRLRAAHSIVTVNVGGDLCLPAALYLGKYRLTHDISGPGRNTWWNLIRADRSQLLEQKVREELSVNALPMDKQYSLADVDDIQRVLYPEYQIKRRKFRTHYALL